MPGPETAEAPGGPSAGPDPGRGRRLDEDLANPMTWSLVDAAVRWSGEGPARPYAVLLGPETVTVRLTGLEPADPPPPWRVAEGGWVVDRRTLGAIPVPPVPARLGRARPSGSYVALGSRGEEIVLLDLAAAPGAVSVTGDPRSAAKLISALIAQLGASGEYRIVDGLEGVPDAGEQPVMLVYWNPSREDLARLDARLLADPRLRALVHGEPPGPRWPLSVDADGSVASAALGLIAAAVGLPSSVAQRPAPPPLGPAAGVRAGVWPGTQPTSPSPHPAASAAQPVPQYAPQYASQYTSSSSTSIARPAPQHTQQHAPSTSAVPQYAPQFGPSTSAASPAPHFAPSTAAGSASPQFAPSTSAASAAPNFAPSPSAASAVSAVQPASPTVLDPGLAALPPRDARLGLEPFTEPTAPTAPTAPTVGAPEDQPS